MNHQILPIKEEPTANFCEVLLRNAKNELEWVEKSSHYHEKLNFNMNRAKGYLSTLECEIERLGKELKEMNDALVKRN